MRALLYVLAGFAVVALLLGWTRWLAGRRWAAIGNLALGLIAALAVGLAWPVAAQLGTFEPQRSGRPVAELWFEQAGSNRYRATLTRLPTGRMQVFELRGEQWRVAAGTLRWVGRAADLGLEPSLRLERLQSSVAAATDGGPATSSDYVLNDAAANGHRVWSWVRSSGLGLLEARRVESPWQPLANGARFELRLTPAGLESHPSNVTATASLADRP